ncbi:hypothetical protein ZYGR_0P00420 [Zygosaccharomyces rouxii]|uniref:ATPase expression protein 1 n=1 Tax=Zygosaccharomyces rouxii TaxID=4956 RepID=A0A1Q3A144_ZYGRO|nr:hypothetical protein ZYGR_0P00420 [Zygosaccharomyces rouxii]
MPTKPRHIPRNFFLDSKSRYQKNGLTPLPHQIIHPFYTPTRAAELSACSKEVRGKLLEGLKVVPALVTDWKGKPLLRNRFIKFDTVKGVNVWLQGYASRRKEAEGVIYRTLEGQPEKLITPSKLHRSNVPLVDKVTELFGSERTKHLNSAALDSIVDELVNDREKNLFCEDVYIYLLQHHVNSEGKLIAIIESIKSHMEADIDQLKVAETLILQLVLSVQRNRLPVTKELVNAYHQLIDAVNQKFYTNACELQFDPLVTQCILEFHIMSGDLNHSKKLLSHLILNGWALREDLSVKYLQLVESKVRDEDIDTRTLKRFAYISDFRPLLQRAQTPLFFAALVPYCRHFGELYSLLTVITEKVHNTREVFDVTLLSMIEATTHMGKNNRYKSANLYELHRTVLPYYDNNLPAKFVKAFALQFAKFNNWSAIAGFFKQYPSYFTPNSIASLLSASQEGVTDSTNYPGGVVQMRKIFIWEYVLPLYSKMSLRARSSISATFDTPKLFTEAIKQELKLVSAGQADVMNELIAMGYESNLLRFIPATTWEDIFRVPHLVATLKPFSQEIESLSGKAAGATESSQ